MQLYDGQPEPAMRNKRSVYRKTPAGEQAVTARSPYVGLRMRSLLILIDGKRSLGDLARLELPCGELRPAIELLRAQGLIEPCARRGARASRAIAPHPDTLASGPVGTHGGH